MTAVSDTAELKRVLALPRRTDQDADLLADQLTELLTFSGGCSGKAGPDGRCTECKSPLRLRRVQALALHDIGTHSGALLPIGVGEGKGLIFWMALHMLDVREGLGLLPASLIDSANVVRDQLANHWLVPKERLRLVSYEMLGRAQSAKLLGEEGYRPGAIICDEVHRAKNLKAACTRRIARYMAAHPATAFVGMSGTILRDSLYDFAHLAFWALKENAPLPMLQHELDDWAQALDEKKPGAPGADLREVEPGALLKFCNAEELKQDPKTAARLGFRRRFVETPGIVAAAGEGEDVGASIYIKAHTYGVSPVTEDHFRRLRGDARDRIRYPGWERPDGKMFEQGVEVWNCARQLSLGFNYRWDPEPPKEWLEARKEWSKFVRGVLARSHTLDSPEIVVQAIDAGHLKQGADLLERWRNVKPTFRPNTVPVWHDDSALAWCAKWMKGGGIVWTEHHFFAQRLAKETGATYFGSRGLSAKGDHIESCPDKIIIASIDANRDGKNLQHQWNRNLIVSPPDGWDWWQQCIARTHRPGQRADEVIVDFLLGCREHHSAWNKANAGTIAARDTIGAKPKLMLADCDVPDSDVVGSFDGWRWR